MMQTAPAPGSLSQAFKSAAPPPLMRPQGAPQGFAGQQPQMMGGMRAGAPAPGGGPMRVMSPGTGGAAPPQGMMAQQGAMGGPRPGPSPGAGGPMGMRPPAAGPYPPQQMAMQRGPSQQQVGAAGQRLGENGGTGGPVGGAPPSVQRPNAPVQQTPQMATMAGPGGRPPMRAPSQQLPPGGPAPPGALKQGGPPRQGGPQPGGFQGPQPGGFQGPQPGGFQGPQPGGFQGPQPGGFQGQPPVGAFKGPLAGAPPQQLVAPIGKGGFAQGLAPQTPTSAGLRVRRRQRGRVEGETPDEEIEEEVTAKGGLATFKNMVVLSENGEMGQWTGYAWKSRRVNGYILTRVIYDKEGRLWCVTDTWEVGTIADGVFKCLGHLGNEFIVDIAFHPVDGALWAVNRLGELLRWGGFALERQQQIGFHKLKAIAFDKKGNLWALNTASELAVWNEELREWDIKDVPGGVRIAAMAFDAKNKLWVAGPEGQLLVLSGAKWINYGFVACWKVRDLAFKAQPEPQAQDA